MKRLAMSIIIMSCMITPAYCIDFWHSSTLYANQGLCAAIFTFDSFAEDVVQFKVSVNVLDKSGKKLSSGLLEIKHFGGSMANRYGEAALVDISCQDNLTIVVKKAHAVIGGKEVDLLKTKNIKPRDFKPFSIRIGK